jgi:hypothetical protein
MGIFAPAGPGPVRGPTKLQEELPEVVRYIWNGFSYCDREYSFLACEGNIFFGWWSVIKAISFYSC